MVSLKNELERFTDQKLDALFVRSRLQEELHEEKSLLSFFQRITGRQLENDIKKITDVDSGLGYTNNTDIMNVFEGYNKDLYASNAGNDVVYQQTLCNVDAPSYKVWRPKGSCSCISGKSSCSLGCSSSSLNRNCN